MDMNDEMCPKKTNRWSHLDDTFKFYILSWHHIVEHTDAHAHIIAVDQMVDNHARRCTGDQQNEQDRHLVAKSIIHHLPTKDQDQAPQGPVDRYVQSQGHHRDR